MKEKQGKKDKEEMKKKRKSQFGNKENYVST